VIWAGALAALITSGIGAFHAGVEWKFWPGPASCSGGGADLGAMTGAELLATDAPTGIIMCDEIVWQFLGLSMAGWNAVISLGLVIIWIMAARRT
jgi:disulfide bond formation protein DsbB